MTYTSAIFPLCRVRRLCSFLLVKTVSLNQQKIQAKPRTLGYAAHFHFCSKRGKCEQKPLCLKPKKKIKRNLCNICCSWLKFAAEQPLPGQSVWHDLCNFLHSTGHAYFLPLASSKAGKDAYQVRSSNLWHLSICTITYSNSMLFSFPFTCAVCIVCIF